MRTHAAWWLVGTGVAAVTVPAAAQTPQVTVTAQPLQMPGAVVGTPLLQPVGTQLPRAAPQAGTPVGMVPAGTTPGLNPGTNPPQQPPGVPIDLSNVIAPYPGMPNPKPSFWQELEKRWLSLFQSDAPAQRTTYTPGIARRNQERREVREGRWRRD